MGIRTTIVELLYRITQVSVSWISSHLGIQGNECADSTAKETWATTCTDLIFSANNYIKDVLCIEWQNSWRATLDNKFLHVKETVLIWDSPIRVKCREEL